MDELASHVKKKNPTPKQSPLTDGKKFSKSGTHQLNVDMDSFRGKKTHLL